MKNPVITICLHITTYFVSLVAAWPVYVYVCTVLCCSFFSPCSSFFVNFAVLCCTAAVVSSTIPAAVPANLQQQQPTALTSLYTLSNCNGTTTMTTPSSAGAAAASGAGAVPGTNELSSLGLAIPAAAAAASK